MPVTCLVFDFKESCKMDLLLRKRSGAADNQVSEWHQKGTFSFTEIVNNHGLKRRAVTA